MGVDAFPPHFFLDLGQSPDQGLGHFLVQRPGEKYNYFNALISVSFLLSTMQLHKLSNLLKLLHYVNPQRLSLPQQNTILCWC